MTPRNSRYITGNNKKQSKLERSKQTGQRRGKKRKLSIRDRVFAVCIAAFLVAAALASALVVSFLKERNKNLFMAGQPEEGLNPQVSEPDVPVKPVQAAETTDIKAPLPAVSTTQPPSMPPALPFVLPITKQPDKISLGKLVFVIDDAGNNLAELEPFLNFGGPLTIAVLPGLPHSLESARRIRAAGKEVFLHQPMEPLGGANPGPGAVYSGMEEQEIRSIINRNLDEIWPVAGLNNHEGSKVSLDMRIMEIVLDICRERGIVFLDSRTNVDTAAPAAAKRLGFRIGERDVFLDNDQSRDSIKRYLDIGLQKAEQQGKAVFIGHARSPELAPLLFQQYPLWLEKGYSLSTMSDLVKAEQ
ncbi:MAG: divergent polysaccharide deacetylase family protein [Treponema sp.]|jgi:polysaccharide deacetylase 2 family uncharacterized protein YibQ|nr:divergent polysaccharide deacetylase family protein [Treponema sp.]